MKDGMCTGLKPPSEQSCESTQIWPTLYASLDKVDIGRVSISSDPTFVQNCKEVFKNEVDPWYKDGANMTRYAIANDYPKEYIGDPKPGKTYLAHVENTRVGAYPFFNSASHKLEDFKVPGHLYFQHGSSGKAWAHGAYNSFSEFFIEIGFKTSELVNQIYWPFDWSDKYPCRWRIIAANSREDLDKKFTLLAGLFYMSEKKWLTFPAGSYSHFRIERAFDASPYGHIRYDFFDVPFIRVRYK